MIGINPHPHDWCAECHRSWGLDTVAVTVAGVTICADCAIAAADVARKELEQRAEDSAHSVGGHRLDIIRC